MAILKIKDKNGNVIPVPVVTDSHRDLAGALKGSASGTNAVRIDDVSTVPHNIDIKLKSVNLIDMLNATTNGYSLPVEHGKTYTISAKLKDNVVIGDRYWGIRWTADDTGAGESRDNMLFHSGTSREASHTFTVGIDNSRDYYIDGNGFTRDDFEYIQLNEGATALPYTPYIDISNVQIKSYGKNVFKYSYDSWESIVEGSSTRYVIPLNSLPNCTLTISGKYCTDNPEGTVYVQKFNGEAFENPNLKGILVNSSVRNITIDKKEGELYRLWTTSLFFSNLSKVVEDIMVEVGNIGTYDYTEFEPYKEPVDGAVAVSPTTTLIADINGVQIMAEYNRDINKAYQELKNAILNLGGTLNV